MSSWECGSCVVRDNGFVTFGVDGDVTKLRGCECASAGNCRAEVYMQRTVLVAVSVTSRICFSLPWCFIADSGLLRYDAIIG